MDGNRTANNNSGVCASDELCTILWPSTFIVIPSGVPPYGTAGFLTSQDGPLHARHPDALQMKMQVEYHISLQSSFIFGEVL
jgi:hypothetical protein